MSTLLWFVCRQRKTTVMLTSYTVKYNNKSIQKIEIDINCTQNHSHRSVHPRRGARDHVHSGTSGTFQAGNVHCVTARILSS